MKLEITGQVLLTKATFLDQSPLVSIIIPTYNRCAYLKETLESIFNQHYSNFEIIVVSDQSLDDTASVIESFHDERCRLFTLENKSNGPAFVRNFGIAQARGSLIAFCDDDDLWAPEKLQKQVKKMNHHPEISIVATNVKYFGDVKIAFHYLSKLKSFFNRLRFITPKYLLPFYNCLVISSTMVRKSVLEHYKFNERDEYQGHEDLDIWLRICSTHQAFILPEVLTLYRVHSNQLSNYNNTGYKRHSLKMLKVHYAEFSLLQKLICILRITVYRAIGY